jgi:ribosomal protein S2
MHQVNTIGYKSKQKTSLLKSKAANMPITEWPGGMLTNFVTIKPLKKNGYY